VFELSRGKDKDTGDRFLFLGEGIQCFVVDYSKVASKPKNIHSFKIEHNLFKSFLYNEFLTSSRHPLRLCPVRAGLPPFQPRQPCASSLSRLIWIHVMSISTHASRRYRTSFGYASQQAGRPFIDVRAMLCIVYGTAKPHSWRDHVDTYLVVRSLHIPTYIFVIFYLVWFIQDV